MSLLSVLFHREPELAGKVDPAAVTRMETIIGSNVADRVDGREIWENAYYSAQKNEDTSLWSFWKSTFATGGAQSNAWLADGLADDQIFELMEMGETTIRASYKKLSERNPYEDWKLIRDARNAADISPSQGISYTIS